MKNLLQIQLIILTGLFYFGINQAHAYEFKHFKLKGELKKKFETVQKSKNIRGLKTQDINSQGQVSKQSPNISPLINELTGILGGEYKNIGLSQTEKLIENHDLGGGVLNFSGFTWHKPMLNYDVTANREIAPELFTDRWIVHDTFTIFVEAATLLSKLKQKNLLEVSKSQIGAFAGVTFTRKYHHYHFADTYLKGLKSDFSKLFLSFLKFNPQGALSISPYEVMKKTDIFTYNAGGVVRAPAGNGLELQAGVLTKTAYKNEVMLQGLGPQDNPKPEEFLRVSIKQNKTISTGAHLSLQYDFFNLLNILLLSYDLEYEYGNTSKTYLSFYNPDRFKINHDRFMRSEFHSMIKGKPEVNFWSDNITGHEERMKENLNSRFNFLLLGNMKKRATEQIKIIKNGVEKTFFKNYSESIKYVQNFFSRLFHSLIKRIFNFETAIKNKAEINKKMLIEYEQMKELGAANVYNEDNFSVRLQHKFFVAETHKWYQRTYKKAALRYASRLTNIASLVRPQIKKEKLRGPITINSTLEVGSNALFFFNRLPVKKIIEASLDICRVRNYDRKKFYNERQRRRLSHRILRGPQRCAQNLLRRYFKYINYLERYNHIDLIKFKHFMGYYFSRSKSINDLTRLFGAENVFLHGDLTAKTSDGKSFQTFFKSGQFTGLGVIDRFNNGHVVTPINTED
ncbi:MAG: hypothetical protein QF441_04410 [Bacteriovoracaceae bacterium]|jgi:hypothetical protein|nr:hypothetical protein [Bacteriovoracaceae bacterium]